MKTTEEIIDYINYEIERIDSVLEFYASEQKEPIKPTLEMQFNAGMRNALEMLLGNIDKENNNENSRTDFRMDKKRN